MTATVQLLTIEQVAEALGTSAQTVYRRVWSGELPTINIGPKDGKPRLRVRESDLQAYTDAREVQIPARRRSVA
jgi:excisionase family DNA binding protein